MNDDDKKICKIDDYRIAGYINRQRSGGQQIFYTGDDPRDWDRYRKEGQNLKSCGKMHNKPDTIYIEQPEQGYYSKLIDGEWWWVNGCDQCNNRERSGMSYSECLEHNVCVTCHTPRADIKDSVWGGHKGWQCKPCREIEHEEEKQSALAAMPDKEDYDSWDYHGQDEITCPYCAFEFSDSFESHDAENSNQDCPRCDNVFTVTAIHSLTFDCDRITPPHRVKGE